VLTTGSDGPENVWICVYLTVFEGTVLTWGSGFICVSFSIFGMELHSSLSFVNVDDVFDDDDDDDVDVFRIVFPDLP